jgi:hypothetical protein
MKEASQRQPKEKKARLARQVALAGMKQAQGVLRERDCRDQAVARRAVAFATLGLPLDTLMRDLASNQLRSQY